MNNHNDNNNMNKANTNNSPPLKDNEEIKKNDTAILVKDLRKTYKEGNVKALDGISFKIDKGTIFSFLGPNGAGKTTTINIVSGYMKPDSGDVLIFGHDIQTDFEKIKEWMGICPQDLIFYESLTVYENLIFFGRMNELPNEYLKEQAEHLIKWLGLTEKRNTLAKRLSGGMKRRLNLLIALVNDPEIIFLDEPTAGLDPKSRRLVWDLIKQLKNEGKTIFLTTHYMEEADELSDIVAIIDRGKLIAIDTPFNLKRKYSKGDLIELKVDAPPDVVKEKIAQLRSTPEYKESHYIDVEDILRISIHSGLKKIGDLLNKLEELGLRIIDMNVKANSLENVFLSLTGRTLSNSN
ncbi:MAG: ABC transporter ATP-binding protein [Promethearchaeota archaeon]